MRYAVCNELFAGWDLDRACAFAAEAGYTGIELAPFTFAPEGVDRLPPARLRTMRQAAASAGLEVVGLHWLLVGPSGLHLTSTDQAVRERTSEYLCALAECCAELGGGTLVLGSPKQRNLEAGSSKAEGVRLAAEVLAPAVERAGGLGVRWSLEPLPATETNFLTTLESSLELDALLGGGPALGVQLDVKSLCAESVEAPSGIILQHAARADRFAHFHANDRNLGAPGSGDVDFHPLFAAIRSCGYSGWISVEVFDTRAGAEAIARDAIGYMRRVESEA